MPMKRLQLLTMALLAVVAIGIALWLRNDSNRGTSTDPTAGQPEAPGEVAPADLLPGESMPGQAKAPKKSNALAETTPETETRTIVERAPSPGDLSGTVVDEIGQPVAEFTLLTAFRELDGTRKWHERDFGPFTDGHFELPDLAPGRWRITAVSSMHESSKRESLRNPYDGDPIRLVLKRRSRITGVVLDPEGRPCPTATLIPGSDSGAKSIEVDDQGRFSFTLKPGPFAVYARDTFYGASERVIGEIDAAEVQEISLQLQTGGHLKGRVLSKDDQPLADWWVRIRGIQWHTDPRVLNTDAEGRFQVPHMLPGTYWAETRETEDTSPNGNPIRISFEIATGETTEIELGGPNPEEIEVRGMVYKDHLPAPGIRVWGTMEGKAAFQSGTSTFADEEGRFLLVFPGPGRANILVSPEESKIIPIHLVLPDERTYAFDIHVPNGQVSGKVKLPPDYKKSVQVSITPEGLGPVDYLYLSRTIKCEDDGQFTSRYLPAGKYRVAVAGVFEPQAVINQVAVADGAHVKSIELSFGASGGATIAVQNSKGVPVSDAMVFAQDSAGNLLVPNFGTDTDELGMQTLNNLGQGEYRFFARKGDLTSPLSKAITVTADAPGSMTLVLEPGGTATLQVLEGETSIYASLRILDAQGNDFASSLASFDYNQYMIEGHESDRFRIGPLPSGTYQVWATALDGRSANVPLVLKPGSHPEVILKMRP